MSACFLLYAICLNYCPTKQQKAPIDVADALKLLSGGEAFQSPLVRKYAVDVLRGASDDELHILLLQLVQALRYEPVVSDDTTAADTITDTDTSTNTAAIEDSAEDLLDDVDAKEDSKVFSMAVLSPLGRFLVERACSSTAGGALGDIIFCDTTLDLSSYLQFFSSLFFLSLFVCFFVSNCNSI